jgi:hypothetical protein
MVKAGPADVCGAPDCTAEVMLGILAVLFPPDCQGKRACSSAGGEGGSSSSSDSESSLEDDPPSSESLLKSESGLSHLLPLPPLLPPLLQAPLPLSLGKPLVLEHCSRL